MNEFAALRARAREQRDKAITQAKQNYAEALERIAILENSLLERDKPKVRRTSGCVSRVLPTDNRRMTRLPNAHSKTGRHHAAMMALWVAYYNFCRKHETLKKQTPAVAAELAEKAWSLKELIQVAR